MGFDKHFYEDHCYFDDPTDVAMNVEIIEDNSPDTHNIVCVEKSPVRNLNGKLTKQSDLSYETPKNETLNYYPYTDICTDHADLIHLEDEKLVKVGDKFNTHDDFVLYLNENAKRWYYYYKCSDSRKPNTESETYTYNCVYLKNKEKYKKKGLRRRNYSMRTDCPCKIKLRHLPNEKELTVVYVCNHHDHELSLEQFYKLQHGRRLPPNIKEEILDFLVLKVDKGKIKKYVEMETGFTMSRPYFYALEKNLQKMKNAKRQITDDRTKMLYEKIAAVDEMYCSNEDEIPVQTEDFEQIETAQLIRSKLARAMKSKRVKKDSHIKRKSKSSDKMSLTNSRKRKKVEVCPKIDYNETTQSVTSLQEPVKCEIQKNPWVSDQCVPALAMKTNMADVSQLAVMPESGNENYAYRLQYYNPEDIGQEVYELTETINDENIREVSEENDVAYETVVTDETHDEIQEYINDSEITDEQIVAYDNSSQEIVSDIGQDNSANVVKFDHIEYMNSNGQIVECMSNEDNVNEINLPEHSGNDIGIQTNRSLDAGQKLLSVFDVYMKDGNVTGFVLNDSISALKNGIDVGIQASEDIINCDLQELENEDSEIIQDDQEVDTYTKHEYVHRYNIDQYMSQPNFPKYVEILGNVTYTDVLSMLTNVYSEKAMFKLTTTQKGNEGNTRICYVTHNGKIKKRIPDEVKKEKLGKKLHSVFILKEKLRMMKKENEKLLKRNKYLEEVALKFVKLD